MINGWTTKLEQIQSRSDGSAEEIKCQVSQIFRVKSFVHRQFIIVISPVFYCPGIVHVIFVIQWPALIFLKVFSIPNFSRRNKVSCVERERKVLTPVWLRNKSLFTYLGLITPGPAKTPGSNLLEQPASCKNTFQQLLVGPRITGRLLFSICGCEMLATVTSDWSQDRGLKTCNFQDALYSR